MSFICTIIKYLICLLAIFPISCSINKSPNAQTTGFHITINSESGSESCYSMTSDHLGNIYCAGSTSGNLYDENGGSTDAFVLKLNKEGEILWKFQLGKKSNSIGDSSGSDICTGVAADNDGNIYCGGYTSGDLGEQNGGKIDSFIMKLNSEGKLLWLTQLGNVTKYKSNAENDYCFDITINDNEVVCGGFSTGNFKEDNAGENDIILFSLSLTDGSPLWATHFGLSTSIISNTGSERCQSLTSDEDGYLYCGGHSTGNFAETNAGNVDAVVLKMNSDGTLVWGKQLGVESELNDNSGTERCKSITTKNSYVYCGGYTTNGAGEENGGGADITISQFSKDNGSLNWIKQLGNKSIFQSNSNHDYCRGIAVNNDENIYCTGFSESNFASVNSGGEDLIILAISSKRELIYSHQQTTLDQNNLTGNDRCEDILIKDSLIYCAGSISLSSDNSRTAGLILAQEI